MTTRKTGGNDKETTRQKQGKNREAIGNAMRNSRGNNKDTRGFQRERTGRQQGDNTEAARKSNAGNSRGEEQGNNHETTREP